MDFNKEDEAEKETHYWKHGEKAKWIFLLLYVGLGITAVFFHPYRQAAFYGIATIAFFDVVKAYIREFRYRGKQINARLTAIEKTLQSVLEKLNRENGHS